MFKIATPEEFLQSRFGALNVALAKQCRGHSFRINSTVAILGAIVSVWYSAAASAGIYGTSVAPTLGPYYYGVNLYQFPYGVYPPSVDTTTPDPWYQQEVASLEAGEAASGCGSPPVTYTPVPNWVVYPATANANTSFYAGYYPSDGTPVYPIATNPWVFGSVIDFGVFTVTYTGATGVTNGNQEVCAVGNGTSGLFRQRSATCPIKYKLSPTDPLGCAPFGLSLYDPIADNLANGTSLVSNPVQLASASHIVQGVAADGTAQVLVVFIDTAPEEAIQLSLIDENGPTTDKAGAGYLTGLPSIGGSSYIQNPDGSIEVISAPAGSGNAAFAIYHAPSDFVRAGNLNDANAKTRTVTIRATDITVNSTVDQIVTIVRPPVVLVHGLWGSPNDFIAYGSGIYGALEGSQLFSEVAFARYDQPVMVEASNPSYGNVFNAKGNTLGFVNGASTILPKIESVVTHYKDSNPSGGPVAAVQVDVVAHSMGGDITRTLPQIPGYADQKTYDNGYVHKLITIDTPHLGSPLATELHNPNDNNLCVQSLLAMEGFYSFVNVELSSGNLVNGATGDLEVGSAAIKAFQTGNIVIPTAMIGGVASPSQLAGAGGSTVAQFMKLACFSNPLAQDLNAAGWLGLMGGSSDAIVPLSSQFDKQLTYSNPANTFQNVVHGSGAESLGFLPPSVLDLSSGVAAAVVTLLNTPVSNPAVYEVKP